MISMGEVLRPNGEMARLRTKLDVAGIGWADASDDLFCRTQAYDEDGIVFSAICGAYAYGNVEVWTRAMMARKEGPVGVGSADEAFEIIRREVGA